MLGKMIVLSLVFTGNATRGWCVCVDVLKAVTLVYIFTILLKKDHMNLLINQSHDWWRRSISMGLSDDDNDNSEGCDLKCKKISSKKHKLMNSMKNEKNDIYVMFL